MTDCCLNGVSETFGKIQDKINEMNEELKRKLTLAGGEIIAESTKITPLETGELRARTFINEPELDNGNWIVNIGYEKGGMSYPATSEGTGNEYAVYVHERMDLKHKIGQAKFLETAFKNFESEMLEYIAPDMEQEIDV